MIVEAIQRLAAAVNGWAIGVLDRRTRRRMLKAFPAGARVRFLSACDCGRNAIKASGCHVNCMGTVEGLTSDAYDYRVNLDGGGYEFMCPKGMVRT